MGKPSSITQIEELNPNLEELVITKKTKHEESPSNNDEITNVDLHFKCWSQGIYYR